MLYSYTYALNIAIPTVLFTSAYYMVGETSVTSEDILAKALTTVINDEFQN